MSEASEASGERRVPSELILACHEGRTDRVRELLASGDPEQADAEWGTLLMVAAAAGHVEVLELLIGAGADANRVFVLHENAAATALAAAAAADVPAAVLTALIELGADADLDDPGLGSALWAAAAESFRSTSLDAVRVLLEAGADPDRVVDRGTERPSTLLGLIASGGHEHQLPMLDLLLDAGADVDLCGREGRTPLIEAVLFEPLPIAGEERPDRNRGARRLIERGADLERVDARGRTAWMLAYDRQLGIEAEEVRARTALEQGGAAPEVVEAIFSTSDADEWRSRCRLLEEAGASTRKAAEVAARRRAPATGERPPEPGDDGPDPDRS